MQVVGRIQLLAAVGLRPHVLADCKLRAVPFLDATILLGSGPTFSIFRASTGRQTGRQSPQVASLR